MKKFIIFIFCILLLSGCEKNKEQKSSNKYKIVDNTEICAEALEEIYRDNQYIYYLPCIKSGNIKIKFDDGRIYKLREVLENNILSIDELIENGLKVYKESLGFLE